MKDPLFILYFRRNLFRTHLNQFPSPNPFLPKILSVYVSMIDLTAIIAPTAAASPTVDAISFVLGFWLGFLPAVSLPAFNSTSRFSMINERFHIRKIECVCFSLLHFLYCFPFIPASHSIWLFLYCVSVPFLISRIVFMFYMFYILKEG